MRGLLLALGLLAATSAGGHAAGRPDRALFLEARAADQALHASKALEAKRTEWDRVILRYRRVVSKYPQSGYCDDALLAIGDLNRTMAVQFKAPRLNDEAVQAYRLLVSEYPSSGLGEQALFSVFEIARDSGDRKRLGDAARAFLDTFPDAARASIVKAAVKKTAPEKAASLPTPPPPGLAQVFNLRFWSGEASTRIVVDLEREVQLKQDRISGPDRLYVDLIGTRLHPNLSDRSFPVGDGLLEKIRIAQNRADAVRIVLDFKSVKDTSVVYLHDPTRLVIDVRGTPRPATADAKPSVEKAPSPTPPPGPTALDQAADTEAVDLPGAKRPVVASVQPTPTPLPSPSPVASPEPTPAPSPSPSPEPPTRDKGKGKGRDKDRKGTAEVAAAPSPSPSPTPSPSPSPSPTPLPVREASTPQAPQANRAGNYSLARQLGLSARRIVIDPGHGGHDPGTIGHAGLQEKDLVLDVSLRLEKMLHGEPGTEVIMTRSTDAYVPLEERTAIANSKGADLFLSVHANSSRNPTARGIETYILNFALDPHAEEVAARENAISPATLKDLQGLVKAIALNSKIDESRDFATSVHESMIEKVKAGQPGIQDRGVRTAPFYVLIGANMPSVLAEISFVSNPDDERLLRSPDQREKIAESLFAGIKAYLEGLNRTQPKQLTRNVPASTVVRKGARRR
jgi:N-acetylmuramoyl-L-alanine amidase